jgi:deoxyribodipyrimidine photo-lyase
MNTIVWFRHDLRKRDNAALSAAAAKGNVVPIFILDEESPTSPRRAGAASRWWLHHSLGALRADLGQLHLFRGDPNEVLPVLIKAVRASAVYWNRCYDPRAIARDSVLKASLQKLGVEVRSFPGNLLHEPWELATSSGGPFKVYTPYWRALVAKPVARPIPQPKIEIGGSARWGDRLEDWELLPRDPDWAAGWTRLWSPGESGALARFDQFLDEALVGYEKMRDRPDRPGTSRLSPHLHWGEISPRQIWARILLDSQDASKQSGANKFLAELGWREFACHLLYHFPKLAEENWRREFDAFAWRESTVELKAWQRGRTGYPLVDAGMRELWQTGWMHNRVRMIAASFLVKHLGVDWRRGEAWFWDALLDADLANNAAGWQWVAGSGADASPFFRIFNPVLQGKKFDPNGDYVRRWCPELSRLPTEHLQAPFAAAPTVLEQAGVSLGGNYPLPIVDLDRARKAALQRYDQVRKARYSSNNHELDHAKY